MSPPDVDNRWSEMDMKQRRLDNPSGWLLLTQNAGVQLLVEALIDSGGREFNKTELADYAGVSRPTVGTHMSLLLGLNVVEEVPNTSPQRYRFNSESPVSQAILQANSAVVECIEDTNLSTYSSD